MGRKLEKVRTLKPMQNPAKGVAKSARSAHIAVENVKD